MKLLESPALTAPLEEWRAWREVLLKMDATDESVAFALRRAEQVLDRRVARESLGVAAMVQCMSDDDIRSIVREVQASGFVSTLEDVSAVLEAADGK